MVFYTILRNQDGNANVPCMNWNGDKLNRNANWLKNDWNSNDRVLLLVTFYFFRLARNYFILIWGGFVYPE